MPISYYSPRNMRMNVSSSLLHELALKANCKFNSGKEEIKEISKDSMQCFVNNITDKEIKIVKSKEQIEKLDLNKIVTSPKVRRTFIPYPDHNYGQQPPLTPPAEGGKLLQVLKTEVILKDKQLSDQRTTETEQEQEGATRCICGFEHDDGYMICCDDCSSWQHVECMGIKSSKVPETYSCHKCNPRELDIERAKAIQTKKRENMSEDDDEEEEVEETGSEDEASNKMMYTAISNTPTRITLLSNSTNVAGQVNLKTKNRKGSRVQKRKLSDQRNTRRKTRRKDKQDVAVGNEDAVIFLDSNSLNHFFSAHKLYEEIEENRCDDELKNMHFKLPEAIPSIDFKKVVKYHIVSDVMYNRKGLVASSHISSGNFILEYKGTLMSRRRFEELNPIFKHSCPYVVSYHKIDHLPLVIDARTYGNDARFIRRSCSPNAEFQHITSNGTLHIMIISKVDIMKDKEITVPFDYSLETYKGYVECGCGMDTCCVKKHNEEWKQANNTEDSIPSSHLVNENSISRTEISESRESETESNTGADEIKQEKLSREERKLQAYVKQFEKLEKKQDTGKKVKEPKTPVARTSVDENSNQGNSAQKAPVARKMSGTKRKMSMSAKRRTRQSSCSSEPVSPTEQDANSASSTPTTPLSSSHTQLQFEMYTTQQRSWKEKEPLTLTLPLQRKLKHEQSIASPTPPGTPVVLSPARSGSVDQTSFSLSVDTHSLEHLESTPLKAGVADGLLQIAHSKSLNLPTTPIASSFSSSFGFVTAEETIGDITSRNGEHQPASPLPRLSLNREEENRQRKYYGSLKKHWLRQHSQSNSNHTNGPTNGMKQISLAALVATLSQQRNMQNISANSSSPAVFKRPQSYVPLKKRHLMRAAKNSESDENRISSDCIDKLTSETSGKLLDEKIHVVENKNLETNTTVNTGLDIKPESTSELEKQVLVNDSSVTKIKPTLQPKNVNTMENTISSVANLSFQSEVKEEINITLNEKEILTVQDSDNLRTAMNVTQNAIIINKPSQPIAETRMEGFNKNVKNEESQKRPHDGVKTQDGTIIDESINTKQRTDLNDDSVSDIGLKIVLPEPSSSSSDSITNSDLITASSNSLRFPTISEIKIANSRTELTSHMPSDITEPRNISESPRSSIDSNPEFEATSTSTSGDHGSCGKKKLSLKEYQEFRNRYRSQKISAVHVVPLQPPLPADDVKPQPPLPSVPVSVTQKINNTANLLLTPRTVSLRNNERNVMQVSKPETSLPEVTRSNIDSKAIVLVPDVSKSTSETPVVSRPLPEPTKRHSLERTQSSSSLSSVFEPVSPGNDYDSESPRDEETTFGHTIHSEITKNPFSIHNNITKNPFGKKLNAQGPVTNPGNVGSTAPNSNYRPQQLQGPEFLSDHDSVENDNDASSIHSNMSSTSYGSASDALHERSYSNHHRSYSREHRDYQARESAPRDYYSNQGHQSYGGPYYQNCGQPRHPPSSRSSNMQRNPGFPPHNNNYGPPNQGPRQRQPHRGYIPY